MATMNEKSQPTVNVSRFLRGINFPAQKQDLLLNAKQNQADREVIDLIQKLDDREYDNISDVMKAFDKVPFSVKKEQPQPQSREQVKQARR